MIIPLDGRKPGLEAQGKLDGRLQDRGGQRVPGVPGFRRVEWEKKHGRNGPGRSILEAAAQEIGQGAPQAGTGGGEPSCILAPPSSLCPRFMAHRQILHCTAATEQTATVFFQRQANRTAIQIINYSEMAIYLLKKL